MPRFLFLLVFVLLISACEKADQVKVSGSIENGSGIILLFEEVGVGNIKKIDSVQLKDNGRFSFRLASAPYPSFYNLKITDRNFITILVHPGEKVKLRADASDLLGTAEISGSQESESLIGLNRKLRNTITKIISFVEASSSSDSEDQMEREIEKLIREQRQYSIAFILEHLESMASITALYQKFDDENWVLDELRDLQYLKIVSESLSKKWPESPHVKALVRDAEEKISNYELARFLSSTNDKTAVRNFPDLSIPSLSGENLTLSTLKARYVLLIFSASWNNSSAAHDVAFKPVYDKFKNKGFDIYQVGLERNQQDWLRYISFNELNWNHVSELNPDASQAAGFYNVTSLPANFLIDKESGILARNISPANLNTLLTTAIK